MVFSLPCSLAGDYVAVADYFAVAAFVEIVAAVVDSKQNWNWLNSRNYANIARET